MSQKKEIVVNDPLLYSGVRFYQSSYGRMARSTSSCWSRLPATALARRQEIGLAVNDTVALDADTTVRFAEFFPDYRGS